MGTSWSPRGVFGEEQSGDVAAATIRDDAPIGTFDDPGQADPTEPVVAPPPLPRHTETTDAISRISEIPYLDDIAPEISVEEHISVVDFDDVMQASAEPMPAPSQEEIAIGVGGEIQLSAPSLQPVSYTTPPPRQSTSAVVGYVAAAALGALAAFLLWNGLSSDGPEASGLAPQPNTSTAVAVHDLAPVTVLVEEGTLTMIDEGAVAEPGTVVEDPAVAVEEPDATAATPVVEETAAERRERLRQEFEQRQAITRTISPEPEPTVEEAPAPPRPDAIDGQPSREQVNAALSAVRSQVQACAGGQGGIAEVRVTVSPSGRVTTAVVGGFFAGTEQGSCMARAVRQAQFPPFTGERFVINYPFQL